jgi:hypothetical protein
MADSQKCGGHDAHLPELIEEGVNPGWRIRVGISRREIEILAEAERQGLWFESEDEVDAFVRRKIGPRQG